MLLNRGVEVKYLSKLSSLLNDAKIAHKFYLDNGRKFQYALIIKKINKEILLLLNASPYKKSSDPGSGLNLISEHLMVWQNQWEDLFLSLNPRDEDEFFFQSIVKFPRNSLSILDKYCLQHSLGVAFS